MNKFMNFRKGISSLFCLVLATAILTGCGESSLYADTPSDYEKIYEVDGISFALPTKFISAATAVTEINPSSDFSEDGVYLYKDGESSYILFSMSQIVVVCEKGTHFDFKSSDDMSAALDNSSILGVWTASTKKSGLDYTSSSDDDGAFKLIANVTAQVSMTTNLFGDFVGKLASIETGDSEWSIFVGIPGTSMSDIPSAQLEVINNVAKSIKIDSKETSAATYEYINDGESVEESKESSGSTSGSTSAGEAAADASNSKPAAENKEESIDESNTTAGDNAAESSAEKGSETEGKKENASAKDATIADASANDDTESNTDTAADAKKGKEEGEDKREESAAEDNADSAAEINEKKENAAEENTDRAADDNAEKTDISSGKAASNEADNNSQDAENKSAEEQESASVKKDVHQNESRPENGSSSSISVNNQRTTKSNKNGAKDSSIYALLKTGEKGTLDAFSEKTAKEEEIAITLKATYKGQEAIDMIKEYIASGKAGYEYTEPPVGTLWEVAEYDIDFGNVTDSPYVNISLYGVDGTKIKKSGVAYSSRTYDMNYLAKEDGSGYMVYYAVPLNCSEYVICAGMGSIDNDLKAAYFLIKN